MSTEEERYAAVSSYVEQVCAAQPSDARYNEYACGCKHQTQEAGKYYDHACASCYTEGITRGR